MGPVSRTSRLMQTIDGSSFRWLNEHTFDNLARWHRPANPFEALRT